MGGLSISEKIPSSSPSCVKMQSPHILRSRQLPSSVRPLYAHQPLPGNFVRTSSYSVGVDSQRASESNTLLTVNFVRSYTGNFCWFLYFHRYTFTLRFLGEIRRISVLLLQKWIFAHTSSVLSPSLLNMCASSYYLDKRWNTCNRAVSSFSSTLSDSKFHYRYYFSTFYVSRPEIYGGLDFSSVHRKSGIS